jgi:hypothetical protein
MLEERDYDQWSGKSWWCKACGLWATQAHVESKQHIAKLNEHAAANEMLGDGISLRRFDNAGLTHLSVRNFKLFWGSRVTDLCAILMDRLKRGAQLAIRWSASGKPRMLSFDDVESVGLVAVSFTPGNAGKYNAGKGEGFEDVAVRWEDLLEAEGPESDAPDFGKFERLIDPKQEVKLQRKHPEGHTWWPAVNVQWKTQSAEHEQARGVYYQKMLKGEQPGYLPCGYQVLDGSNVIDAWPIRFVQLSRL